MYNVDIVDLSYYRYQQVHSPIPGYVYQVKASVGSMVMVMVITMFISRLKFPCKYILDVVLQLFQTGAPELRRNKFGITYIHTYISAFI